MDSKLRTRDADDAEESVQDTPSGAIQTARQYVGRVLRFELVWVVILLLANWVATVVAPEPGAFYGYYGLFMPVSYVVFIVVLAPVMAGIALAVRRAVSARPDRPRLVAFAVATTIWAILIATLAASAPEPITGAARLEAAITLGISVPLFGLLMPLSHRSEAPGWRR